MAFVLNADEVFKMAEQIERNGAAFYRLAAGQFPKQNRIFLTLADQEDKHQATFAALRRDLPAKDREESTYDPGNEASGYLKAMADRRVFDIQRLPGEILKEAHTLEEVIQVAIGLEKDSIVFYSGMQAMVPIEFGRDSLALIIREELKHIVFLNNLAVEQAP